ncbi:hypothetical protein F1728_09965 [Gimesia benthica]|uniref:Uncharacterized protein n=1 Tax=Gimesia benthica TaxID=2608982 RepID=A0A6I6AA78_9PLAN|nr:hypothetical protein [Gimesia benthica]QGQ22978.1 hypothetical protein F1728_09965 [Gimesia benthica]
MGRANSAENRGLGSGRPDFRLATNSGFINNLDSTTAVFDSFFQWEDVQVTGYTVHTGSSEDFTKGWDRIFGDNTVEKAKKKKKSKKKTSAKKKDSKKKKKS